MKDSSNTVSAGAGNNNGSNISSLITPASVAAVSAVGNATPTQTQAATAQQQQQQQQQQPASQQQQRKSNIHELRNQDYVSRLMAATPPYLYSAPVGPNNFFFSDMLRSLVQARNNETARVLQLQQQQQQQHQQQQQQQQQQAAALVRRPRKRSWSHRPYYEQLRERREAEEKQSTMAAAVAAAASAASAEKPLELTNKTAYYKYSKLEELSQKESKSGKLATIAASDAGAATIAGGAVDSSLQDTPPAASLPPQDLVLPPPPPVWYPPLYAPYGIDPLHFFIDLRVSGHIYDRKKENVSPLSTASNNNSASVAEDCSGAPNGSQQLPSSTASNMLTLPSKQRHGSAFTVPIPKSASGSLALSNDAINLCAANGAAALGKFEHYAKYYDLGESKENQPAASTAAAAAAAAAANFSKSGASYMLQHLPRLYSQFAAQAQDASFVNEGDNKSESADLCDDDSLGRGSSETNAALENSSNGAQPDRDIDVEIIDSIKYRTDGESSRCSSNDEASITQID